jgi:hypothetical protein
VTVGIAFSMPTVSLCQQRSFGRGHGGATPMAGFNISISREILPLSEILEFREINKIS